MNRIEGALKILAVAFLAVIYGFAAQRFKLFPYEFVNTAFQQAAQYTQDQKAFAQHYLHPVVYQNTGARSVKKEAVQPGLNLITSYWPDMDWRSGIKLIDREGNTLHSWKTEISELKPDGPGFWKDLRLYVHGSYLFPNGDILLNIEQTALFMIDACGEVKWHLDETTHHSVARDADGNFWIPSNSKLVAEDLKRNGRENIYPGLSPTGSNPVWADRLLKISPEGEILEDINLLDVLYDNDLQRYIAKISKRKNGDVLHLNDIDILDAELADQYPLFEAGDLAISLRHLHMILVMDPNSGQVKWYDTDPWIEQHDPDFTGDGWITVFDNNWEFPNKRQSGRAEMLGGSRIVSVRPHTGELRVDYPRGDTDFFFSRTGGKFQQLENGNLLITENNAGRIFEIDENGDLVWEWINEPNQNQRVAEIHEGTRYPLTAEDISQWACHNPL